MSDIQIISATTPFLEGVPNSQVSPVWYRVLYAIANTLKSQNTTSLQDVIDGLHDVEILEAIHSATKNEPPVLDARMLEINNQPAMARLTQAIEEINNQRSLSTKSISGIEQRTNDLEIKLAMKSPAPSTQGVTATITTAKLTTLGANGSMTFVNGLLTAQTPAT